MSDNLAIEAEGKTLGVAVGKGARSPGIVPGSAAPWRMLVILTVFAMLASVDKQFLALVVVDIKRDLALDDIEMGLILGIAFALSNVAISLPAGWLADRVDRRRIIAGAVGLWSLMTMACGAAGSFTALFAARLGVGMGEGISPPASYSMLRDGIPPALRGRAFGFFSIGGSFGGGVAYVLGGALLAVIAHWGITALPLIGAVKPWQMALIVIGLIGLPLSLLAFAFPDPGRGGEPQQREKPSGLAVTFRLMAQNSRAIAPLAIYSILLAMLANGWAAWAPAVIGRTYGLVPQQIGPMLGIILMVGAPVGLLTTGILLDRIPHHRIGWLAFLTALIVCLSIALVPQMPGLAAFWGVQSVIVLAATTYLPMTSTLVARVMPAGSIGQTMAIFLFLQGAFGAGLGPLAFALVARHVFGDTAFALNHAVTATALVLGGIAALAALLITTRRSTASTL